MTPATPSGVRPRQWRGRTALSRGERGSLSLEAILVLPVIALLGLGLVTTVAVLRDVLLLHEAARVGARLAATTTNDAAVANAARDAAPELAGLRLALSPSPRGTGEVVTVTTSVARRVGPTTLLLRATAHARVEPVVDGAATGHPWWQPGAEPDRAPRRPWRSDGWSTVPGPDPGGPP